MLDYLCRTPLGLSLFTNTHWKLALESCEDKTSTPVSSLMICEAISGGSITGGPNVDIDNNGGDISRGFLHAFLVVGEVIP